MTAVPTDDPTVRVRSGSTLPALDAMRAFAAIAVVGTHVSFWGGAYGHQGYGTALARLDFGVAIFFVLSGFLLSRPWFERHVNAMPPPSTRAYLWRRALRILPAYLVTAVVAMVVLPGNDDASVVRWLQTLTLTNSYFSDGLPSGLTQMWSLSTETAFYVALPLLLWLALSRRGRTPRPGGTPPTSRLVLVLTSMLVVNVAWLVLASSHEGQGGPALGLWLPAHLTWFGVGMLIGACAVGSSNAPAPAEGDTAHTVVARSLRRMGQSPGACWTAGLALFALASTPLAGPTLLVPPASGEALTKNLLYAASAGLLVLPGVFAHPTSRYVRALSHRVLRHLGHLSYGLFCVHLVVLELVVRWRDMELFAGRTLELFTLTLVVSLLVAELLYRFVERPAMRWRDAVPGSRSGTRATTTPRPASTRS